MQCLSVLFFFLFKSSQQELFHWNLNFLDIGTSGNFEKVMDAFCKNLTSAFTSSTKINTGKEETRYLKKLQILTRWEEIQKVKQTEPKKATASSLTSWFTKLWKGCYIISFATWFGCLSFYVLISGDILRIYSEQYQSFCIKKFF